MDNTSIIEQYIYDTYMSKKPSIVYENTVRDFGKYTIEVYLASDPEDKQYISLNRKFIKKFFDDGYAAAHLGKFMGCYNENSVKQNTSMLKVAKDVVSGEIIAMTIYSSKLGGFKCVGGTVISGDVSPELRQLGKKALANITREDTQLWNQFIWTECSGKIEDMWSSYGGIKLPSAYLPLFMDEKMLATVELPDISEEPYRYRRIIQKDTPSEQRIEKVIFGFPSREVLDKFITDSNTTLEEFCHQHGKDVSDISEAHVMYRKAPKEIQPDLIIMMRFLDIFKTRMELTEYEMDVIYKSTKNVFEIFETLEKILTEKDSRDIYRLLLECVFMINRCSVIKPYELGEMMEPEVCRFPEYMLMPDALEM